MSTKYSPSFNNYLNDEFNPAQEWATTTAGRNWIKENIPTLDALIRTSVDDCIFGVYLISINGKPWYAGESVRLIRRLIVHAYHLRFHSTERFGIDTENCALAITVRILSRGIYSKHEREVEEQYWISNLHPLLQPSGNDTCVPRRRRRALAQMALSSV